MTEAKRKLVLKSRFKSETGILDFAGDEFVNDRARIGGIQMTALGGLEIGTNEEQTRKNLLRNHLVLSSYIPTNSLVKSLECELDAPDPGLFLEYPAVEDPAELVQRQVDNETGLSTLDLAVAASHCESGLQI